MLLVHTSNGPLIIEGKFCMDSAHPLPFEAHMVR